MRRAPAFTYALALMAPGSNPRMPVRLGYKIGWAFDWKARMRTFNHAALPALGGLTYGPGMKRLWPTAMAAFRMEQAVLRRFEAARHRSNHEVVAGVTKDELELAWASCMAEVERHPRSFV